MTISKVSAIALVSAMGVTALAMPVYADDSLKFDRDFYISQLRYDGVNAIAVSDVTGDTFRATIRLDDGSQAFAFFDKDSLTQLKR